MCLEPHQLPWIHRKIRGDGQDHVSNHVCWMEEHFLDTTQDFIFKDMAVLMVAQGYWRLHKKHSATMEVCVEA